MKLQFRSWDNNLKWANAAEEIENGWCLNFFIRSPLTKHKYVGLGKICMQTTGTFLISCETQLKFNSIKFESNCRNLYSRNGIEYV